MPEQNLNLNAAGMSVGRGPTLDEEREKWVPIIKEFRQQIDALIQKVPRGYNNPAPEGALLINAFSVSEAKDQVRIHLIDAKMWAGKMLEGLGNPFPPELADKANVQ